MFPLDALRTVKSKTAVFFFLEGLRLSFERFTHAVLAESRMNRWDPCDLSLVSVEKCEI